VAETLNVEASERALSARLLHQPPRGNFRLLQPRAGNCISRGRALDPACFATGIEAGGGEEGVRWRVWRRRGHNTCNRRGATHRNPSSKRGSPSSSPKSHHQQTASSSVDFVQGCRQKEAKLVAAVVFLFHSLHRARSAKNEVRSTQIHCVHYRFIIVICILCIYYTGFVARHLGVCGVFSPRSGAFKFMNMNLIHESLIVLSGLPDHEAFLCQHGQ
jgi:predicted membrane protein